MMIDGEKYACESCVRGHRVSNCTHADRQLQHINKKGRPVSQCQHCRAMRRSKSAHVKCDCGEKTSKCVHLQPTLDGHRDTCCCNHGGRCTCSHKKDVPQPDTIHKSDSDGEAKCNYSTGRYPSSTTVRNRRSRAGTQNSDRMLTFDEHGHHKPTYKHARSHRTNGPYQLNRGYSTVSAASRSVESLPIEAETEDASFMLHPHAQRLTKSETASPSPVVSAPALSTSLPPLDLSSAQNWAASSSFTNGPPDMFGGMGEFDQPVVSAGLGATIDWGQYGLDFSSKDLNSFAPSSYSQAPSFGGYEPPSTLPSGEVSEVEDLGHSAADDFDTMGPFSRANTASTGFGFNPSQEDLVRLNTHDFNFNKLDKQLNEGNKYYDSASALIANNPLTGVMAQPEIQSGYVQDDPLFFYNMQETEVDYLSSPDGMPSNNDGNFWQTA